MVKNPQAARRGLLVIALGTLGVPLDSTVNVAFPAIAAALDLPIPAIQWIVVSYVLTYASLLLACGRIGDIIGHRRVFLIGTGWSVLAFAACAAAPSFPLLLAGRVAQGIGAALVTSCGPALATGLFAETERVRVLGHYTMLLAVGGTLGAPVAGAMLEVWGWQSVFAVRVPIALAALILATWLPSGAAPRAGGRFDAQGALLLALSLAAGLGALNELQRMGMMLALLALLAVASAAAFVTRELSVPGPIVDVRLFRLPGFALINLVSVLTTLSAFAVLLLLPFLLRQSTSLTPFMAGCMLAISPLGVMIGSFLAGSFAPQGNPRAVALTGALLNTCGLITIVLTLTASALNVTALLALSAGMMLSGTGAGLFQVAYLDSVTATMSRADRGVAGGLAMLTRMTGTLAGATVLMLIFETIAVADASTDAFRAGLRGAFTFAAVLGGLAALILLSLKRSPA